ncbi:MAG TPA: lysylphosphatidylglycerol synthase transmembrane domain-containing protein [Methylomirabilota bacterium]|nr:lysylphosphatidylglycerol synthase transmembrane domain-containing protein [Methylomirabilota bacterium]
MRHPTPILPIHETKPTAPIEGRGAAFRRLAGAVLPLALLAAVFVAVGVDEVAALASRLDWRIVALALAVTQVQLLASAVRWALIAGRLGVRVPIGRAYLEYALGGLLNMLAPGGVAGDVLRTVRTVRGGAGTRAAVRSVMLDRIVGQAAFWVVAGAGLLVWAAGTGSAPGGAVAAVVAVPLIAAAAVASVSVLARRGPARVRAALTDLGPDLVRVFLADGALAPQLALSLGLAASYVGVFALAGHAIGSGLPPLAVVALIPLALLSMLVPIGVGGWGLREGAAAVLWPLAGLGAAEGAATAALYGAIVTIGGLPGILALRRRREPADRPGDRLGDQPATTPAE